MSSASPLEGAAQRRRVPTQRRSLERVERLLDAASQIVVEQGVEALTTRSIAEAAEVPVASLYQYFSDKDGILLALVERDMAEMDDQVRADLAELTDLSLPSIVATTMRAYVRVYHRRPAFVEIWLRGRTNPAIRDEGRAHNKRTAAEMFDFARAAGLVGDDVPLAVAELAVEVGDRCFQLAFEHDLTGDPFLVDEGVALVTGYLQRHLDVPAAER